MDQESDHAQPKRSKIAESFERWGDADAQLLVEIRITSASKRDASRDRSNARSVSGRLKIVRGINALHGYMVWKARSHRQNDF